MHKFISKTLFLVLFLMVFVLTTGCSSKESNNNEGIKSNITEQSQNVQTIKEHAKSDSNISTNKESASLSQLQDIVYGYNKGDSFLNKYKKDNKVNQIILVEQSDSVISMGVLYLLIKNKENEWQESLRCKALLGKNGIDKVREGDKRTPTGDYGFLMAFGAQNNPDSIIPYTKLTDTMYLCGDKEYYNQFIDISKLNHKCNNNSEHLIKYIPQYNYALFLDYNKEHTYGKGSAIFLHCFGNYPFTLGCISISEDNMVKVLRTVDANARICIYSAKG